MKNIQRGFTLIEVLVSILILVFGMLGAASLQLKSKQVSYDASQRALAAFLVQDITERIRANTGAVAQYQAIGTAALGAGTLADQASNCRSATCTQDQIAAFDLWEIERMVVGGSGTRTDSADVSLSVEGLANPTVCITPVGGAVTVAIAWRGSIATSDSLVSTCGSGSGKYGADDEFRQVFTLSTYVSS